MGQRIQNVRRARRLTQEKLAEQVEVSASFIGHLERGEKEPSLETMIRLSRSLEVSMDYLVLGKQDIQCEHESCALYEDLARLLASYSSK